jgi:CheR methyltransferase-like protein
VGTTSGLNAASSRACCSWQPEPPDVQDHHVLPQSLQQGRALGLEAIKAHGGLTLAQGGDGPGPQGSPQAGAHRAAQGGAHGQAQESADPGERREPGVQGAAEDVPNASVSGPRHERMPGSAVATGAVDIVAPVEAMASHILAVRQMRREARDIDDTSEQTNAAPLAICSVLHRQPGHDFSGYKENTFLRRVRRRMEVGTPECLMR